MKKTARLLEMINLLGGDRLWSAPEMADRFGVSTRTIYRDLEQLEKAHVPVVRRGDGYRLMPESRLRPFELTVEERAMLAFAINHPSLRTNEFDAKRRDRLAAKLGAVLPLSEVEGGPEGGGDIPVSVMHMIEQARNERRVVEIEHAALSSGARTRRLFHPWLLVCKQEAWYVAGHCPGDQADPRFFRLDRIEAVRVTDERFEIPSPDEVDESFRQSWSELLGETL